MVFVVVFVATLQGIDLLLSLVLRPFTLRLYTAADTHYYQ